LLQIAFKIVLNLLFNNQQFFLFFAELRKLNGKISKNNQFYTGKKDRTKRKTDPNEKHSSKKGLKYLLAASMVRQ
jgi:hypothetical protein